MTAAGIAFAREFSGHGLPVLALSLIEGDADLQHSKRMVDRVIVINRRFISSMA